MVVMVVLPGVGLLPSLISRGLGLLLGLLVGLLLLHHRVLPPPPPPPQALEVPEVVVLLAVVVKSVPLRGTEQ